MSLKNGEFEESEEFYESRLPLFTRLPRRLILGNWVSGNGHSRKLAVAKCADGDPHPGRMVADVAWIGSKGLRLVTRADPGRTDEKLGRQIPKQGVGADREHHHTMTIETTTR